jgi:Calcineurin-like phosphoesterase
MSRTVSLLVVSDIHYAGEAERARGHPREALRANLPQRLLMRAWDGVFWMRDPLAHNHLLDRFLEAAPEADWIVANGDFACNGSGLGLSDDAVLDSARQSLGRLRARFGERLLAVIGDHELGKTGFVGGTGGMRLASWPRAVGDLAIEPFWQRALGRYTLLGVASPLVGLPLFHGDALPAELPGWEALRAAHLETIRAAFARLPEDRRVILFCHDPSVLTFLRDVPELRARMNQIELTIVGHLHSEFILRQARRLAGFPRIGWLGATVRHWTYGLSGARCWKEFNVVLCPALAGIEWDKLGGWLTLQLDPEGQSPARVLRHDLRR